MGDHEKVLVRAGVRFSRRFSLFKVVKETEKRFYGVDSHGTSTFIDKKKVVKRNATDEDLRRVQLANKEMDGRIRRAREWFDERMAEICG